MGITYQRLWIWCFLIFLSAINGMEKHSPLSWQDLLMMLPLTTEVKKVLAFLHQPGYFLESGKIHHKVLFPYRRNVLL